ncbi:BTB/POZ domain-containing protein KCTD8 [Paragonimus heterotremus]|uniref:BTB/POZ domain-containing protein KCTD8 n=1 Tax=Paragonimus heterotremus TaxID=100268 RepID=A0A8J4X321_9TREM|nr:BTB/POZ domain-containing protein KCTD8 [Paragonimus heterotremus]
MSRSIVRINVGGKVYATGLHTIHSIPNTYLASLVEDPNALWDEDGNLFIDRDGILFRYILDFYRYGAQSIPRQLEELERLKSEAKFYGLEEMVQAIEEIQKPNFTCITLGYRGTFSSARDGTTDLRFRKLARLLVAGQNQECRRVFGDTLNDTRDPDTGSNYSSRFFLKHTVLEQAFDMLYNDGYKLACACASGTNGTACDLKVSHDEEEIRWQHYNEFVFVKNQTLI